MHPLVNDWLDEEGRVSVYPTGGEAQQLVLSYLASKFKENKFYKEAQVDDILSDWHTFGAPARLRQDLLATNFLTMKTDGSHYWKVRQEDDHFES